MPIKMNDALIKQINIAKIKNHDLISKGTGIDKSTISLHLNSKRPLSIEHAKEYAKYLNIPLIKVIDDSIVKYRVVKYIDPLGEVHNPNEDEFDVIIAPNELTKIEQYCIYDKEKNTIYWYDPKITCKEVNVIGKYTFIKSKDKSYLGVVLKENKGTVTFVNRHTNKTITVQCANCHPMTAITFCDFATHTKVENSL